MNCLMRAWQQHEGELRRWLVTRLPDPADAEDLLQDIFLKALRKDRLFCELENARAWLFEVTRNTLTDRMRAQKHWVELPEDIPALSEALDAVDTLADCLPHALKQLAEADRDVIVQCDLHGMSQREYAQTHNLSLAATKARILRARKRLRETLAASCHVRFDEHGKVCCFTPSRADRQ
jgi:RNA polymerase sigma-70 factor (ECF subfamily)